MAKKARAKTDVKKLLRMNYQQVLFVFLAFLAMVLVSYFYVADIVRTQMFELGEETMNTIQTAVSASLSEAELAFANMAQTMQSMLGAGRTNRELLEYLIETNRYFGAESSPLPDFMKVYGFVNAEFIDGSGWVPPEGYEPTQRPWYIGATGNGTEIFFSEPYLDAETGGMCISFSKELLDAQGLPCGVVAIDLKLSRVADYVARQKIVNNGYGVLLSDTLHFTTHRDAYLIGASMSGVGGDYPRLAQMLMDGQAIAAERFTDADGTDSIAFFRTIFNGWHIGTVIPRAHYYAQVYRLAAMLAALGFVLMTALSVILVRTRAAKMRSDEESLSKSTFLARMSHEMRTPMNAIIGMTGIARKSEDMERIKDCLGKIDGAANHLLGVINDVLDMSKIEAGKLELSETDFPFQKMIEQVTTVAGFRIEEKHQRFTLSVSGDVPAAIMADRQRLAQVIANFLSNANKFTPEGGNISLSVQKTGEVNGLCELLIEVADDGIGISKDQQARLFRSFEQADSSISRKYGGTGLGLVISKTIVELMGGKVWVESEPGKGSKFSFTVLVRPGGAQAEPKAQDLPAATGQGKKAETFEGRRILLAEDVEINREILLAMLEDTCIAIDCAEDGQQAVEMFAADQNAYDMIFMDIHMPKMDGFEATRRIRAMGTPRSQAVPIVAMTANVFKEDVEACLRAGMNGHVGKPLEMDEVMAKLRLYLSRPAEASRDVGGGVETPL